MIETQAKESKLLLRQGSGVLDRDSALDILSIKFVELLLLVSDCCSAKNQLLFCRSYGIAAFLRNFAYSVDCKPLTLTQL